MICPQPALSFIYPIYNRADLFERTLRSFLKQKDVFFIPFEILLLDDGSNDNIFPICKRYFLEYKLPIQYIRLDLSKLGLPVFKTPTGANNPAPLNNVGIKMARSPWVVLSSPEVRHSKPTNLKRMYDFAMQLGADPYSPDRTMVLVSDVWDDSLNMFISGGPNGRPLHFLTVYSTRFLEEIGGFEEEYVQGWGAEDVDFVVRLDRAGVQYVADRRILGYHQFHPRPEIDLRTEDIMQARQRNLDLLRKHQDDEKRVKANEGREWGAYEKLVVDRWPRCKGDVERG
jgi:glycosyltransferase involved in cell wall biosynthesis